MLPKFFLMLNLCILKSRTWSSKIIHFICILNINFCGAQIPPLTIDEAHNKFEGILKSHHRSLNKDQREMVSKFIQECPLPLYVEVSAYSIVIQTGNF